MGGKHCPVKQFFNPSLRVFSEREERRERWAGKGEREIDGLPTQPGLL